MDRDVFRPYPAATPEEEAFLSRLTSLPAEEREVASRLADGTERTRRVRLTVEAEEPFGGERTVVARLSFEGETPGEDEELGVNLWDLLEGFLREREERARSGTGDAGR